MIVKITDTVWTTDQDVNAWIAASGVYQSSLITPVYNFVTGVKSDGIWPLFNMILVCVGPTNKAHGINIINPSKSVTWIGNPSVSNLGIFRDATGTQYGRTGIIPSTDLILNDTHVSAYVRTAAQNGAGDIGAQGASDQSRVVLINRNSVNEFYSFLYANSANGLIHATPSASAGFFMASRTSSTNHFIQQNGTTLITANTTGGTLPGVEIYLMGSNINGKPSLTLGVSGYDFFSIGRGLTTIQATQFNTRVNQLQIDLGRNVV